MRRLPQELDVLLDVLVEAVLRELNAEQENADESGQEQRRRGDQTRAILHGDHTPGNSQPR